MYGCFVYIQKSGYYLSKARILAKELGFLTCTCLLQQTGADDGA